MTPEQEKNRRILTIDDNESIHEDIRKALTATKPDANPGGATAAMLGLPAANEPDWTYPIDSALQGQEGLQKLKEAREKNQPYSMAFVDMRMPPGWDGLETIEHLWREDPDLQVVICTAYSDHSWEEMIRRLGTSDRLLILKKPFDMMEVRQLALALTEKWNLTQAARRSVEQLKTLVEQRTAEAQTIAKRLQIVVDTAEEGIIFYDADGHCELYNPKSQEITGYSQQEIVSIFDLIGDLRSVCQVVDEPQRDNGLPGDPSQNTEMELRTKNNQTRTVLVTTSSVEYLDRQMYLSVFRDITEKKLAEAQMAVTSRLESIGQLAAGIAHEINTPSQYISDNTHFLKSAFSDLLGPLQQFDEALGGDDESPLSPDTIKKLRKSVKTADLKYLIDEIPPAIGQSLEGIDRVTRILRAMKEFSHPSVEKTQLDINSAINSTITVASNEWKYVAEMETDLDDTLGTISAVPGEFSQVLLNMIVNAAHAIADVVGDGGKGKGKIRIATKRVDDWAEIRISDSGCGIPAEIREKVFDQFFTTKAVGKGTGQGLAIAHNVIVTKHGGTLGVESEVGSGSTFIIRLPVVASETVEAEVTT